MFLRPRSLLPMLVASAALLGSACSDPAPARNEAPPSTAPEPKPEAPAPSAPPVARAAPAPVPDAGPAAAVSEAERLFTRTGCGACHGPRSPFYAQMAIARTKPPAEVARWIRNARALKPNTMMPSYESTLSEADALTLAKWIIAGNPKPQQ